jgi:simple sugar transport system ATP-binding protein
MTTPEAVPLIQARDITKTFGTLRANDAVSLRVLPAEVHALLGENGAGKSTLVKIIYGLLTPDAGDILWQGQPVRLSGPAEARRLGIGMVFQHFSLFENLTVAENVALGLPPDIAGGDLGQRVRDVSASYGLPLEPDREVWRLSVGERQRIEIVRTLLLDPKLLILDEPTSVLTPAEAEQLFATLAKVKAEGRSILYISHKLDEVRRICDAATILRGGKLIATCDPRQETVASLARMMVGADVAAIRRAAAPETGPVRLRIDRLSLPPEDTHGTALKEIALEVRAGEIVGIAGVAGNGQGELFAALSGERQAPRAESVVMDGTPVGLSGPSERRRLGAAFVPEERLGHATASAMPLSDNALLTGHALGRYVRRFFVDRAATAATVDHVTTAFDVRKGTRDPTAKSLSGGNLQKFVVGREVLREPRLLVVSQPTWGVDAGATLTIRQALVDLARSKGAAVLVISQDLDELFEMSDRIAVMFHGHLSTPEAVEDLTRESVGLKMAGVGAPSVPREVAHAS